MNKCSYLLFNKGSQTNCSFNLTLNDISIPRVRSVKLLGTWIDDRLTWETHVRKLLTKLKCGVGMLQCSQNLLTGKAKKLLYFGPLHSNLCYCLSIWGTMIKKKLMTEITRLQRKAVRLIDSTIPINKVFTKHRILTFEQLVRLEQCKLGYKLYNNLLPQNLAKSMKQDHNMQSIIKTHKYPTQNKHIPNLPHASADKYCSSFLYRAIKEYSDLNPTLQNCKTLSTFSHKCKKDTCLHLKLFKSPL